MKKEIRNRLIILIVLAFLPILFLTIDYKLDVENNYINSLFFVIATLIVTMTIYVILSLIIKKYPSLFEKGIWNNPFHTLMIGTLILFVFILVAVLSVNNLDFSPTMNKGLTFIMAYPVVFVLILMIDSFYKGVFNIVRERRLFISSISVVFILAIMILFGSLSNM
ncbi:MAG: hypothetical protein ACQEWU_10480 [Bacillota bacterium]|uniref:Uncharacterized protein n=1 Tax=Virgibacillus salarius TaxID=447199 RepID=A0A941DYB1_9BACI|nr:MULTISPECIES: hypothetical protein [Bacillaceae]MBR7797577.1 hypothetical protein [Virgibacillus salarius]NAZ10286.1 hypothetical protein [Agaribacter marinus]WBX81208.1 hypothetical protein PD280_05600 [Virgibacillus salarius]